MTLANRLIIIGVSSLAIAIFASHLIFEFKYHDRMDKQLTRLDSNLSRSEKTIGHESDSTQSIAELRRDLTLLTQQVAELAENLTQISNVDHKNSVTATNLHPDNNTEPALSQTERQKRQDSIAMAYFENVNNHFEDQTPDIAWANQAEDTILNTFENQVLSGSQVTSVECRSTLCRAEIQHDSMQDMETFKLEFSYRISSTLPASSMRHSSLEYGRHRTIVYLAKKGHDLSMTDNME